MIFYSCLQISPALEALPDGIRLSGQTLNLEVQLFTIHQLLGVLSINTAGKQTIIECVLNKYDLEHLFKSAGRKSSARDKKVFEAVAVADVGLRRCK